MVVVFAILAGACLALAHDRDDGPRIGQPPPVKCRRKPFLRDAISCPSRKTSNCPSSPTSMEPGTPVSSSTWAARLAARCLYPQAWQ
jgi:hypothetical protein